MAEAYQKYLNTMMEKLQKNRLRVTRFATAGATAFLMGVVVYKYRQSMINTFVMPAAQVLPAEFSHNLAVWALKYQIVPTEDETDDLKLRTQLFGHDISNPIGIAAGFDKHGEAILGLRNIGFGFVEIGSVTPEPQKGNAGPRVFRLSSDRAVINRYGFNSEGHEKVLKRLRAVKEDKENNVIVGVNLGRNRRTKGVVHDYVKGVEVFGPYADYLVINVSSPNTKGLRDLQSKDKLEYLLERVNLARDRLPEPHNNVPILLKLSPDLDMSDVKDIVEVIKQPKYRVDGLIVANTTTTRDDLKDKRLAKETGGLSGAPLRKRSTQMIAYVYKLTNGKIPIIGVGGIESGRDAYEKIEAGASFVQFYTALVFGGPEVVTRIKNDLTRLLYENEVANVQEIVGKNNRHYLPNASSPTFRRHHLTPKLVEAEATNNIDENPGHNF